MLVLPNNLENLLSRVSSIDNLFRRQLAIGSIITKIFIDNNLHPPVIVGGSVVALYSSELYKTVDLDMKSEYVDQYKFLLKEMGYIQTGKDFYNSVTDSYIEFPSGKMEDSEDHFREFEVEETGFPIIVLGFEDIILDRVSSFVATSDKKSQEWAIRLIGTLYAELDWDYMHKRSNELGILSAVNRLQRRVKYYKGQYEKLLNETSISNQNSRMKLF
jgi:hypothetical protein